MGIESTKALPQDLGTKSAQHYEEDPTGITGKTRILLISAQVSCPMQTPILTGPLSYTSC